ncbi:phage tail tube protein [uncultured Sphaerochaeta sp.]|uniref:phage tail tube protein n=1 Tax=uncultured Sphaerochaeta sp. TaxID=886478 RepID=UPI002AA93575|nr:phage tail tube protein [uncultured Sphaerochaeta sp.]
MGTQVLTGKDGKVKVGEDQIAYCDNWSMDLSQEAQEVLRLGTNWAGAQGGKKGASGSIGGSYSETDTALAAIITSWLGEEEVRADIHLVQSATKEYSGSAVLSSFNKSTPAAGKVTWSANFTFDGAPVEGAPVV